MPFCVKPSLRCILHILMSGFKTSLRFLFAGTIVSCSFYLLMTSMQVEQQDNERVTLEDFFSPQVIPVSSSSSAPATTSSSNSRLLRYDWTNLPVQSNMAKKMVRHEKNCSLPLGNFRFRNRYGLGSDLHVWGQAFCNAMEEQMRIRTLPPWTFWDQDECQESMTSTGVKQKSPMLCYFPSAELSCPGDREEDTHPAAIALANNISNPIRVKCDLVKNDPIQKSEYRAASIEYLFRNLSPLVVREAERQLKQIFPKGVVPSNLITVHIRWGDKKHEMKLLSVNDYIKGVKSLLSLQQTKRGGNGTAATPTTTPQNNNNDKNNSVNIFLSTEDPRAVEEFQRVAPPHWNIFVDGYFVEMIPHRIDEYSGNTKMSRKLRGKGGLVALGSLLVAVEANDFVLTTKSNWSRLMNELRKNVIDPRCGNCTRMIDLKHGEW